jgi:pilus assembly protein CpaE
LELAGEAAYGTEATYSASELNPHVVLIALEDPPVRGLATLEALQFQTPDTPVIAYSSSANSQLFRSAMRVGARDFLEKPLTSSDLRDAIHTALAQEEQRQLRRWSEDGSISARGTVLTVAGAKGGTGKTTIATNLAIALRIVTGQEVALVDCDAQFGDVATMLDMSVERSVADLARSDSDITRATVHEYLARHESGVNLLLAADEPDDWRALQPDHVSALTRALAESHEYVVLDTPGTMNQAVAASLAEAAIVLLVTSLDVSSIKDTKTALRILESWDLPLDRVRLVVNNNTRVSTITPDDVAKATGREVAESLPNDPQVGVSVQTGVPVVLSDPGGKFARSVTRIAERIAGVESSASVVRLPFARIPLVGRRA